MLVYKNNTELYSLDISKNCWNNNIIYKSRNLYDNTYHTISKSKGYNILSPDLKLRNSYNAPSNSITFTFNFTDKSNIEKYMDFSLNKITNLIDDVRKPLISGTNLYAPTVVTETLECKDQSGATPSCKSGIAAGTVDCSNFQLQPGGWGFRCFKAVIIVYL